MELLLLHAAYHLSVGKSPTLSGKPEGCVEFFVKGCVMHLHPSVCWAKPHLLQQGGNLIFCHGKREASRNLGVKIVGLRGSEDIS